MLLALAVPLALSLALPLGLSCVRPAPLPDAAATTRVTPEVDGLRAELVTDGPAAARVVGGDGASLVLLYGGEEAGELGPCGCQDRPRGGLARIAAYRDAVRAASPGTPVLVLHAGNWLDPGRNLDGSPRLDAPERNGWMVRGLAALAPDVLNVGAGDMHALAQVDAAGLALVSANLERDGLATWQVLQAGELTVGVTGIAAPGPGWLAPEGWTPHLPAAAARQVLTHHGDQVDLVVLLSLGATDDARALAEEGLVDVVIDANSHRDFTAPFRVGDAVWVRSHFQTMRLGELRLQVEDGRVTRGWDRKVDLDPSLAPDPGLALLERDAEAAISRLERSLYGRRLR